MKNREDFTQLSEHELEEKYRHFKEELFNLRFQVVTGQLANPSRIKLVRRNIARVQTFINKLRTDAIKKQLADEYQAMLQKKGIDSRAHTLADKIAMLKQTLSGKANQVKREIRADVDQKVSELLKTIRNKLSERIKTSRGAKDEAALRASNQRLRNENFQIRKKFLDKLVSMGLNEASQIASLKETKRTKLNELERIQALQRELNAGRLPF